MRATERTLCKNHYEDYNTTQSPFRISVIAKNNFCGKFLQHFNIKKTSMYIYIIFKIKIWKEEYRFIKVVFKNGPFGKTDFLKIIIIIFIATEKTSRKVSAIFAIKI